MTTCSASVNYFSSACKIRKCIMRKWSALFHPCSTSFYSFPVSCQPWAYQRLYRSNIPQPALTGHMAVALSVVCHCHLRYPTFSYNHCSHACENQNQKKSFEWNTSCEGAFWKWSVPSDSSEMNQWRGWLKQAGDHSNGVDLPSVPPFRFSLLTCAQCT